MSSTPLEPTGNGEQIETILVVEDEDEVRKVVCLTLELQGYRVIAAATAEQALAIMQSSREPIDLLLTDVVLPMSSGPELATRAKSVQPGLRVLYVSGYSEESLLEHGISSSHPAFLPKPFSAATLGRKVRSLMARQQ